MSQLLKDKNGNDASAADDILSEFKPWTELGRWLAAKRAAIIESGIPLLDDKELAREIAERRGGVTTANTNERQSSHFHRLRRADQGSTRSGPKSAERVIHA